MLLGVDVGGTFTDAVLVDGERIHTAKLPTTPGGPVGGVIAAVEEVLARAGAGAATVESFAHGMTVGTNALLEERGARTALIATRGFADLLEIGRQDRPHLYRLCAPKPAPLVERGAALRGRRADRPRGRGRAARRRRAGAPGRGDPRRAAPSRWRSACSSPTSTRATSGASPSTCAASCPACTSPPRTRSCPASASTSAARRRRSTPTSPPARPLPRRGSARRRADGRPARSRWSCSPPAASRRRAEAARAGRLERPLRPRRRRGRRRPARPRSAATATRSASTWAAPPATSAWSRTARCGAPTRAQIGGRADPAADGRRPHGRRRRRLDRLARPRRRAARRPALGRRRPRARLLRPRRQRADRDRRQPAARLPRRRLAAGRRRRARRRRRGARRSRELAASLGLDELRDRRGDRPRRQPGDGARAARGHGRARRRPAPLRPAPLRRRRADARGGDRRRARHRARSSARAPAACSRRSASAPRTGAATRPAR